MNLTEGANGVPTTCLQVGKAFLWRDCLDLTAYTVKQNKVVWSITALQCRLCKNTDTIFKVDVKYQLSLIHI